MPTANNTDAPDVGHGHVNQRDNKHIVRLNTISDQVVRPTSMIEHLSSFTKSGTIGRWSRLECRLTLVVIVCIAGAAGASFINVFFVLYHAINSSQMNRRCGRL